MDLRQYDPAMARWVVQDPVVHHDYSPYSAFDNNPVYRSDPSGADSKPSFNMSFQGDEAVQLIYNILVTVGTIKETREQMAALYGFDSYEDFLNSFNPVKVGLQKGSKIEVHYFRNNITNEVFDVKIKYNYWHQKSFKNLN